MGRRRGSDGGFGGERLTILEAGRAAATLSAGKHFKDRRTSAQWAQVLRTIRNLEDGTMSRRNLLRLTVASLIGLCATFIAAQEKQTVSFNIPPENSKYTQQRFIDVGDTPGHQVRVFELHRTFPSNRPVINGIKLAEMWARGLFPPITPTVTDPAPDTSFLLWKMETNSSPDMPSKLSTPGQANPQRP